MCVCQCVYVYVCMNLCIYVYILRNGISMNTTQFSSAAISEHHN